MYYLKIISSMVFVAIVGFGVGFAARDYDLKGQALSAKVAHYNTDSGRFEWGSVIPQTSTADLFAKAIEEPPRAKVAIPSRKPDAKKKTSVMWSGQKRG